MDRLSAVNAMLAALASAGVAAWSDADQGNLTEARPPNIVFMLADDVSADELAPYGGAIAMPNLQRLADDGLLFRNAWSTPVCAPSRAMMMTGKYPHHTGYYENPVCPEFPFWEDPRHLPVLKMMREAGKASRWRSSVRLICNKVESYPAVAVQVR